MAINVTVVMIHILRTTFAAANAIRGCLSIKGVKMILATCETGARNCVVEIVPLTKYFYLSCIWVLGGIVAQLPASKSI